MYPKSYHAAMNALITTGMFRDATTRHLVASALRELCRAPGIHSERLDKWITGRQWAAYERARMLSVNPAQFFSAIEDAQPSELRP